MVVLVVAAVSPVPSASSSVDDDDGDAVVAVALVLREHHPHRRGLLLLPRCQHRVVGVKDVLQDEHDVGADEVPDLEKKEGGKKKGEVR